MKVIKRISVTLIALILGIGILLALIFVGQKTEGPLDDLFKTLSGTVDRVEEIFFLRKKVNQRGIQTKWLKDDARQIIQPTRIISGIYDDRSNLSLRNIFELEGMLNTTFGFIQIYAAWGSHKDQQFPRTQVRSILKSGSIPVITWEPWLTDFEQKDFTQPLKPVDTRDKNGMIDIASGLYDDYIRKWAKEAAKINEPILLRFGHEMNDPYRYPWGPQNNKADEYVEAWRHVHDLFKEERALNVFWVWSPHPAYGWFDAYYPGTEFVDWVGVGALNYGTVAYWSKWWTFDEIFGQHYEQLSSFNKPIMISEFGCLAVGGDRLHWYEYALRQISEKYTKVRAVLFFNYSTDLTTTQQPLDWSIHNDPDIIKSVSEIISSW
jgi:hypothetical protein